MLGKLPANLRSWLRLGCKSMQPKILAHEPGGGALGTLPDIECLSEALLCGDQDLSRSVPRRDSLAGAFEKFPETALQSDPISHFDNPDFDFDFDESNV